MSADGLEFEATSGLCAGFVFVDHAIKAATNSRNPLFNGRRRDVYHDPLETGRRASSLKPLCSPLELRKLHPLEDCGNALTAPDAHRYQRVAALNAMELVYGLGGDDGACCADRVA